MSKVSKIAHSRLSQGDRVVGKPRRSAIGRNLVSAPNPCLFRPSKAFSGQSMFRSIKDSSRSWRILFEIIRKRYF